MQQNPFQEREQVRLDHHEQMQLRHENSVSLPDIRRPKGMGKGMGPRRGMGGMGPGGGWAVGWAAAAVAEHWQQHVSDSQAPHCLRGLFIMDSASKPGTTIISLFYQSEQIRINDFDFVNFN